LFFFFFFFQAEDGIRDFHVTGVQTCALPILTASCVTKSGVALGGDLNIIKTSHNGIFLSYYLNSKKKLDIARLSQGISVVHLYRSEERRVGKECRSGWSQDH